MAAGASLTVSPLTIAAPLVAPDALFAFLFSSRLLGISFTVRLTIGDSLMPGVIKSICGAICSGT